MLTRSFRCTSDCLAANRRVRRTKVEYLSALPPSLFSLPLLHPPPSHLYRSTSLNPLSLSVACSGRRHSDSQELPVRAAQDALRHEGVAPQHLIRQRSHLSDTTVHNSHDFLWLSSVLATSYSQLPALSCACVTGLDILKNEWSPALTLRTAMLSLQALLSTPNPDDPQDAQVAGQYKKNKADFERTAAYWTATYAMPAAKPDVEGMVGRLSEMGFDKDKCVKALEQTKYNENAALEYLISH